MSNKKLMLVLLLVAALLLVEMSAGQYPPRGGSTGGKPQSFINSLKRHVREAKAKAALGKQFVNKNALHKNV